jgi:hypothetical protein
VQTWAAPGRRTPSPSTPAATCWSSAPGRQDDVLRFCHDTRVWPTNNISERDHRYRKAHGLSPNFYWSSVRGPCASVRLPAGGGRPSRRAQALTIGSAPPWNRAQRSREWSSPGRNARQADRALPGEAQPWSWSHDGYQFHWSSSAALATGRSLRQQHWAASTATAGGTKNTTSDHPADGGP